MIIPRNELSYSYMKIKAVLKIQKYILKDVKMSGR